MKLQFLAILLVCSGGLACKTQNSGSSSLMTHHGGHTSTHDKPASTHDQSTSTHDQSTSTHDQSTSTHDQSTSTQEKHQVNSGSAPTLVSGLSTEYYNVNKLPPQAKTTSTENGQTRGCIKNKENLYFVCWGGDSEHYSGGCAFWDDHWSYKSDCGGSTSH